MALGLSLALELGVGTPHVERLQRVRRPGRALRRARRARCRASAGASAAAVGRRRGDAATQSPINERAYRTAPSPTKRRLATTRRKRPAHRESSAGAADARLAAIGGRTSAPVARVPADGSAPRTPRHVARPSSTTSTSRRRSERRSTRGVSASASSAETPTTGRPQDHRQALHRGQADAQPGEGARSAGDDEQVEVARARRRRSRARVRFRPAAARRACARRRRRRREHGRRLASTATLPARVVVSSARIEHDGMIVSRRSARLGRESTASCSVPIANWRRPARATVTPGHAPVLRRQAAVSQRHRVLPDGRLLRDVLRGRAGRGARARSDADVAVEGRVRHRRADVRRAVSRRRHLHRAAGEERATASPSASRSRIRARPRAWSARGRARRVARHADRRVVSRCARTGVPDVDCRHGRVGTAGNAARSASALLDLSTGEFNVAEYGGPRRACRRCATRSPCCSRARSSSPAGRRCRALLPEIAAARHADDRDRRLALRARDRAPDAARAAARRHPRRASASSAGRRRSARPARCSATCATRRRPTSRTCASIRLKESADCLLIDPTTLKHLEVVESMQRRAARDRCSHEIDRTDHAMGGRLLRAWLLRPLVSLEAIRDRLDAVEELAFRTTDRGKLRETLEGGPGSRAPDVAGRARRRPDRATSSGCASRSRRSRACACCSASARRRS